MQAGHAFGITRFAWLEPSWLWARGDGLRRGQGGFLRAGTEPGPYRELWAGTEPRPYIDTMFVLVFAEGKNSRGDVAIRRQGGFTAS